MLTHNPLPFYSNLNSSTFFQLPLSNCSTNLYLTNKGPSDLIDAGAKDKVFMNRILLDLTLPDHQGLLIRWLKAEADKLGVVIPDVWTSYFKRLYKIAELANFARENGVGVCYEAASLSIRDSLLNQLKTGERESVQLIAMTGEETVNQDGKSEQTIAGHFVALYNAEIISKEVNLQQQSLDDFFKNTKAIKPNGHIICDAWIKYHDTPNFWWRTFKNDKDTGLENVTWKKLEATDYSLPSFRGDRGPDNPKLRNFLRETLIDILSGRLRARIENALVMALSVLESQFIDLAERGADTLPRLHA